MFVPLTVLHKLWYVLKILFRCDVTSLVKTVFMRVLLKANLPTTHLRSYWLPEEESTLMNSDTPTDLMPVTMPVVQSKLVPKGSARKKNAAALTDKFLKKCRQKIFQKWIICKKM